MYIIHVIIFTYKFKVNDTGNFMLKIKKEKKPMVGMYVCKYFYNIITYNFNLKF